MEKEKLREYQRKWRENNLDKARESHREWRRNHREERNAERKKMYNKTSYAENHKNKWEPQEIDMVLEHAISDTDLARILGRSVQAIQKIRWKYKDREDDE